MLVLLLSFFLPIVATNEFAVESSFSFPVFVFFFVAKRVLYLGVEISMMFKYGDEFWKII